MTKLLFFSILVLLAACASSPPYQLPILSNKPIEFPLQYSNTLPLEFQINTIYPELNEITSDEKKKLQKTQFNNALIAGLKIIEGLTEFHSRLHFGFEKCIDKLEENDPQVSNEIKLLCNIRNQNLNQNNSVYLGATKTKKFGLLKLIKNQNGILLPSTTSESQIRHRILYKHEPCTNNSKNCLTFDFIPGTAIYSFQKYEVTQIIWRDTGFDDNFNKESVEIDYDTLTMVPRYEESTPVIANLDLVGFFIDNVPILKKDHAERIERELHSKIEKLEIPNDELNRFSYGYAFEHSDLTSSKVGKDEENFERHQLWTLLLIAETAIEFKRVGNRLEIRFIVNLPEIFKKYEIKPRQYLLTKEYENRIN